MLPKIDDGTSKKIVINGQLFGAVSKLEITFDANRPTVLCMEMFIERDSLKIEGGVIYFNTLGLK